MKPFSSAYFVLILAVLAAIFGFNNVEATAGYQEVKEKHDA